MTTYKDSGVDIDAADDAKQSMRKSVDSGDARVLNTFGAFASLVEGSFPGYKDPVLVLKTEEPGSKQKLAFGHGFTRSICEDTINHLVNDIAMMGAVPLYAQDLIICGKIDKKTVTEIVDGFASACKAQGCVLTGGETTEQPGVLAPGMFAIAASIVGIVERRHIVDGSRICEGDTILAVASNGLHTNGFTLVRSLMERDASLAGKTVGKTTFLEAIMLPHTCYLGTLKGFIGNTSVHGMAHITGGGMQGNINRILPEGLDAAIDLPSIRIPEVFGIIRDAGNVEDAEMLQTFNMGVGMTMIVDFHATADIANHIEKNGYVCNAIGTVRKGTQSVVFEGRLRW